MNNPEDPAAGTRRVRFGREIYVERDDFMEDPPKKFFRLSPGSEVRLRYAYFVTCREAMKDAAGEVVELRCTYDPETRGGNTPPDGRKVKATLHWVSAADCGAGRGAAGQSAVPRPDPDAGQLRRRPQSGLAGGAAPTPARAGDRGAATDEPVQFERLGYFVPRPGLRTRQAGVQPHRRPARHLREGDGRRRDARQPGRLPASIWAGARMSEQIRPRHGRTPRAATSTAAWPFRAAGQGGRRGLRVARSACGSSRPSSARWMRAGDSSGCRFAFGAGILVYFALPREPWAPALAAACRRAGAGRRGAAVSGRPRSGCWWWRRAMAAGLRAAKDADRSRRRADPGPRDDRDGHRLDCRARGVRAGGEARAAPRPDIDGVPARADAVEGAGDDAQQRLMLWRSATRSPCLPGSAADRAGDARRLRLRLLRLLRARSARVGFAYGAANPADIGPPPLAMRLSAAAGASSRRHPRPHRGGAARRQRPHRRGAGHGRPARHRRSDRGCDARLRPRPHPGDLRPAHGAGRGRRCSG